MRALVIDDSETYRELITHELHATGITATAVSSLAEAMAEPKTFDLVICDHFMPRESIVPRDVCQWAKKMQSAVFVTISAKETAFPDIVKGSNFREKLRQIVRTQLVNSIAALSDKIQETRP